MIVVFSKNRAMQLDLLLRSLYLHNKEQHNVTIIYTTTDEKHENSYALLKQDFPRISFIKQTNFKQDLLQALENEEYVLFLVDDCVFIRDFSLDKIVGVFKQRAEYIGFSLRLGLNTTYRYPFYGKQTVPVYETIWEEYMCFNWTTAGGDFAYPLELSSSLYRVSDTLALFTNRDYNNPNELETIISESADTFRTTYPPLLLSGITSIAFCNMLNKVNQGNMNRCGGVAEYSIDALLEKYENGYRINLNPFVGFVPEGCHQEVSLDFITFSESR